MASAGTLRAGKAVIELGFDDQTSAGMRKAEQSLRKWGSSIQKIGQTAAVVGGSITAAFGAAVRTFVSAGDALNDMATRTGFAVETLSELKYAAEQSGTSIEAVGRGVKGMAAFMLAAERGSAGAVQTLSSLGVTLSQLQAQSPEQRFLTLATAIAKVEDPTKRAALAAKVFKGSGEALLPLLADGAEGFDKLREEAHKAGAVMSKEQVAVAARLDDAWNKLTSQAKGLAYQIGDALGTSLEKAMDKASEWLAKAIDWVKANKKLVDTLAKIALAVTTIGTALVGIGLVMGPLGAGLGVVVPLLTALSGVLIAVATNPIVATFLAVSAAIWGIQKALAAVKDEAPKAKQSLEDFAKTQNKKKGSDRVPHLLLPGDPVDGQLNVPNGSTSPAERRAKNEAWARNNVRERSAFIRAILGHGRQRVRGTWDVKEGTGIRGFIGSALEGLDKVEGVVARGRNKASDFVSDKLKALERARDAEALRRERLSPFSGPGGVLDASHASQQFGAGKSREEELLDKIARASERTAKKVENIRPGILCV